MTTKIIVLGMRRWPIIRHVRYFWYLRQVNKHYEMWSSFGYLPVHAQHDIEYLNKIWRGEL